MQYHLCVYICLHMFIRSAFHFCSLTSQHLAFLALMCMHTLTVIILFSLKTGSTQGLIDIIEYRKMAIL